jgi:hypothetical protein
MNTVPLFMHNLLPLSLAWCLLDDPLSHGPVCFHAIGPIHVQEYCSALLQGSHN